jgi:hypothetical protein
MSVFTQRPDSTTGYDTYLKSTSNKATENKLAIGRKYTAQETVVTQTITGYTTYYKVRITETGQIIPKATAATLANWMSQGIMYKILLEYQIPNYTTTTTVIPATNSIYTSLLQFDLSSLLGTTVNSATLVLYMWGDNSRSSGYINIHRCLRNWVEAQAASDVYSTGNAWQTERGWGANDHASALMGTATLPQLMTTPTQINIALDNAEVQTMINGGDHGMWMCGYEDDTNSLFYIGSSNHTTEIYRPFISIEHSGTGTVAAGGISCIC